MGQQQLLLIVLGVIIVGIAVVIGIKLFTSYSIDAKRNNIINEGVNLAANAQQYFRKPKTMQGGDKSFTGWTIPKELDTTSNGWYSANVQHDVIVITGRGNDVVTADNPVEVTITIRQDSYKVNIIH